MFREALIQKDIPKKEFEENEAKLREQLLIAQERLKKLNSQLQEESCPRKHRVGLHV